LTLHLGKSSPTPHARPPTTFCKCGVDSLTYWSWCLLSTALGVVDFLSLDTGSVSPGCMSINSFVWRFCLLLLDLHMMLKVACPESFFPMCSPSVLLMQIWREAELGFMIASVAFIPV
jgi:hypothetical protein